MPRFVRLPNRLVVFTAFFLLALSAVSAFASGSSPKLPNPGFMSVGLWNEENGVRLDIAVWYPTQRAMRDISLEGWFFQAGKDGSPVPGLYPVILLSHNAASSRLFNHDLAAHLARHGFIVVAPTHPKDNVNDTKDFFHAANFMNRPKHLVLALEKIGSIPALAAVMDRGRIGVLGVGSGAATALQLAGASPDLSRLTQYCPPETNLDPLCSNWGKTFHSVMQNEFFSLLSQDPSVFTTAIERTAAPSAPDASLSPSAVAVAETRPPKPEASPADHLSPANALPDIVGPPKPEKIAANPMGIHKEKQPILAVGLLTPGNLDLFPDASLHAISAQIGIFSTEQDAVYASAKNAERLQAVLPQRPALRVLPNENFYDLQAPCPPAYLDTFPALCGTQTPVGQKARKLRNDFFTKFYQKSLGLPLPQLPASQK